jgi:hypothetical protein
MPAQNVSSSGRSSVTEQVVKRNASSLVRDALAAL